MIWTLESPTSGRVLFSNGELGKSTNLDIYQYPGLGFIFQALDLMSALRATEEAAANEEADRKLKSAGIMEILIDIQKKRGKP